MSNRLFNLFASLAFTATASLFAAEAIAQTTISTEPIPDLIERALNNELENFFDNTVTFRRQIDFIFGPGSITRASYIENEINRDLELVDLLYRDLLYQQVASDPIIRTPDLRNPFETSLRLNPSYRALGQPVIGGEFVFERLPLR